MLTGGNTRRGFSDREGVMAERPPAGFDPAIADYYERAPEESRLQHGAFQLEGARTRELIERHAPPAPATVLDVGGAAGAYAFWLAERGYDVHLVDATPRLVAEARRRNEGAARPLASCRVGDARAIPAADESAAMVLMLGPLYHLIEAVDRRRALAEAARVLRPGGTLIAAAISRCASALDGLARDLFQDARFAQIVAEDVRSGQHRNTTERIDYFTTAYFHRPEELRAEIEEAGLVVEGLYGIEGPGWILTDLADRWADSARRATLLHVARLLEREPAMLGSSAHLLAVGRKGKAERA
jgi:ubiquinone/menaquinone biosynthesis C-methylase UbiE